MAIILPSHQHTTSSHNSITSAPHPTIPPSPLHTLSPQTHKCHMSSLTECRRISVLPTAPPPHHPIIPPARQHASTPPLHAHSPAHPQTAITSAPISILYTIYYILYLHYISLYVVMSSLECKRICVRMSPIIPPSHHPISTSALIPSITPACHQPSDTHMSSLTEYSSICVRMSWICSSRACECSSCA
jgi:hypothetical protein